MRYLCGELENVMNEIESFVLSLNGPWQGDAERAYSGKIIYVKKEYSKIMKFFDDYAGVIFNCGEEYEQYDSELSSKIKLA